MTAPTQSMNQRAAELVCRHAVDVDDARLLLEVLGLVEPGGRELLPDDTQVITRELLELEAPSGARPREKPVLVREPPDPRQFVPEGLRNLPPAAPPTKKAKPMPTAAQEQTRGLLNSYGTIPYGTIPRPLPKPAPVPTEPDIRDGHPTSSGGPYITALSVVELFVDHTYQRPLDEARVRRMVADWNPRMLGILEVSDRGRDASPRYAVINGQHRWATAGRAGVQYVPCSVHEGLTVEDEARLMFELDRSTKALSSWDKWRSRRAAGDPTVLIVERVAAGHGMTVTPGGFGAVGAAEALIRAGGEELLETTTSILVAAYGATAAAVKAPMLTGLGQLVHEHGAALTPSRMVQALQKVTPEQLRAQADAYRTAVGGTLAAATGVSMASLYNRLPGSRIAVRAA